MLSINGSAKPIADYNDEIKNCYKLIINLKLKEATSCITAIKKKQPDNLAIIHLENYIDFFTLFITESKEEYNKRIKNKDIRLGYMEQFASTNPHIDFIKAEILLQWALIHIKFDEKITAGSNVYSAYKLLENNKKKFPNFTENNKSLSIIHVLAESVPKWVRKLIGIKGSISLGQKEIEEITKYALQHRDYFYREEVAAISAYISFYQLNQKDKAIDQLNKFGLDHSISPLICFLKSSIHLRAGNNELCLKTINDLKADPTRLSFFYLDFMKGRSLLYKQDAEAKKYLELFVNNFRGQHFIKEAYQKLAWYELSMNNDIAAYKRYMALCLKFGVELSDEDKQAAKEARSGKIPNAVLLKARILYDGGYYIHAQNVLIRNEYSLNGNAVLELEFNYRMGRILQALRNYPDAIQYLKQTLKAGESSHDYLAASAALQLGMIYEENNQLPSAKFYYEKCLQLDPSEYKTSIHQKAKSGIQRIDK